MKKQHCLFVDGMSLYLENPKTSTDKLLELVRDFNNLLDTESTSKYLLCYISNSPQKMMFLKYPIYKSIKIINTYLCDKSCT